MRSGLWYDFRNPAQWRQPADRLYREILDQIAWGENNGFHEVWLSEHHFIEDGYLSTYGRHIDNVRAPSIGHFLQMATGRSM
jgi:alkanesulfonate monooxygenase SsuD/methylene tetrahydromethanopterin reductase-like flavin-dependent oxidoreductase (luciferase family)